MKRLRSDSGVYEIFIGLVALGVIAFILLIEFRSPYIHSLSLSTRARLGEVCHATLKELPVLPNALAHFSAEVKKLVENEGYQIEQARLLIPVYPLMGYEKNGPGRNAAGRVNACDNKASGPEALWTQVSSNTDLFRTPISFSAIEDMLVKDYDLDCGTKASGETVECLFIGNACQEDLPDSYAPLNYPPELLVNSLDFSINAVCEFSVKSELNKVLLGFLSEEDTVIARTAHWSPIITHDSALNQTAVNPEYTHTPGLTIIVAPQIHIPDTAVDKVSGVVKDPRFTYMGAGINGKDFTSLPQQNLKFKAEFDPLVATNQAFTVSSNRHRKHNASNFLLPELAALQDISTKQMDWTFHNIACASPATLVRNTALWTLANLAGRHAQTRAHTQVIMAQSAYRARYAGYDENDYAMWYNPGTIISRAGDDITARQFKLPFVFVDNGINGDPTATPLKYPSVFGPALGNYGLAYGNDGRLQNFSNPFENSSGTALNGKTKTHVKFEALQAGQLRNCHSIWTSKQISAPELIKSYFIDNDIFEPTSDSGIQNGYVARTGWPSAPLNPWAENENPWDFTTTYNANFLNIAELFSTLGVVQQCPITDKSPAYEAAGKHYCHKPDEAYHDHRGDIISVLKYASSETEIANPPQDSTTTISLADGFPVALAPGLHPISNSFDTSSNPYSPLPMIASYGPATPRYQANLANDNSPILIVTSQALGQIEKDLFWQASQDIGPKRPIILLYFPTSHDYGKMLTGGDEHQGAQRELDDFVTALMGNPVDSDYEKVRHIFIFSPFAPGNDLYDSLPSQQAFAHYWYDMMHVDFPIQAPQDIVSTIEFIWKSFIIRYDTKF